MTEKNGNELIEAYCVSCKDKRMMQNPEAVWTSQGRPGTQGTCPVCGSNMFRMGRTALHHNLKAPQPVEVVPGSAKGKKVKAAYIAADVTQADFADKLGQELKQIGVPVWVDNGETADNTKWAGGIHPAMEQCTHLVVVLSQWTSQTTSIQNAIRHYLDERKPIIVAMAEAVDPPDAVRNRPRFDFTGDYKTAFRELVAAISR
ncbi:MAG: TIR domain-containing protein [Anaerolineae bacterium]|nr:MAG: TIR domain-containing protein [Anaerolineae bacterium]